MKEEGLGAEAFSGQGEKKAQAQGPSHSRGLPGNWDGEVVKVMGGGFRSGVGSWRK